MLKSRDLTYQYPGSKALAFPDISVKAGEALLICGESGCGKTTLLHLLAGLRKPGSGQIFIDDALFSEMTSAQTDQYRGRHIGMVYQQSYFIESLSIIDNLLLSPYAGDRSKTMSIANRLDINDLMRRRPSQLSIGQQQRASIARAIMSSPRLILADEPTSALDNRNCLQVLNLLKEEALSNNAALVIVTHDDRLRDHISSQVNLEPVN